MIKLMHTCDLSDCTLIIPSVAVGNVGQLVADLVISNGNFKKIGHILTCCFIPIIGVNPYLKDSMELCTTCDIYHESEKKLIAIQIRSLVIKKLDTFFHCVKQFIETQRITKVIILTSGWSHTRNDVQIQTEPMRYIISPEISSEFSEKLAKLNGREYEKTRKIFNDTENVRIPGGGFALDLYKFLNYSHIPTVLLLRFCSEGDNIPDAIQFLNYLCKSISLHITDIKVPNSWKYLFGKPAPTDLY